MIKNNNKGFTFIELLVSIIVAGLLVTSIISYSQLQNKAFTYKNDNSLLVNTMMKEYVNAYAENNWQTLNNTHKEIDMIRIEYVDYSSAQYGTERIRLTVSYLNKDLGMEYTLERVNTIE